MMTVKAGSMSIHDVPATDGTLMVYPRCHHEPIPGCSPAVPALPPWALPLLALLLLASAGLARGRVARS